MKKKISRVGKAQPSSTGEKIRARNQKTARFEVWESRSGVFLNAVTPRYGGPSGDYRGWPHEWATLLPYVNLRRKRIRVRTFYDRRLRRRVVQVLVGNGYGAR